MEGLFNPVTILLHIVNTVILLWALNHFLYKPVRKFTTARAEDIETQLKRADETEGKALDLEKASRQKLRDAEKEAQSIVAASAQQAHEQAQQILDATRKEVQALEDQARLDVETMMNSAHQTMADEAASLAVEIASKMLSREVKLSDHQQLVEEFVKKVG